jgi:hypothetical protein
MNWWWSGFESGRIGSDQLPFSRHRHSRSRQTESRHRIADLSAGHWCDPDGAMLLCFLVSLFPCFLVSLFPCFLVCFFPWINKLLMIRQFWSKFVWWLLRTHNNDIPTCCMTSLPSAALNSVWPLSHDPPPWLSSVRSFDKSRKHCTIKGSIPVSTSVWSGMAHWIIRDKSSNSMNNCQFHRRKGLISYARVHHPIQKRLIFRCFPPLPRFRMPKSRPTASVHSET